MGELNEDKTVSLLTRILEHELAGVVRDTHYSLLVFGFNRIPIVDVVARAGDAIADARATGRGMITHLRAYRSLTIGPLLDTALCGSPILK